MLPGPVRRQVTADPLRQPLAPARHLGADIQTARRIDRDAAHAGVLHAEDGFFLNPARGTHHTDADVGDLAVGLAGRHPHPAATVHEEPRPARVAVREAGQHVRAGRLERQGPAVGAVPPQRLGRQHVHVAVLAGGHLAVEEVPHVLGAGTVGPHRLVRAGRLAGLGVVGERGVRVHAERRVPREDLPAGHGHVADEAERGRAVLEAAGEDVAQVLHRLAAVEEFRPSGVMVADAGHPQDGRVGRLIERQVRPAAVGARLAGHVEPPDGLAGRA